MILEVCVESAESAVNAEKGGARRIELCANLAEGGTTPSIGMLKIIKQVVRISVFVMIRPRGGDFLYSDQEHAIMKEDIKCLKEAGADGFVFGALTSDGAVDMDKCQDFIDLARPLPVTFHKAIDMSQDMYESLEDIIRLGCDRVLTSGGESSSLEGAPVIRRLTEQAGDRIIVIPGGGITEKNIRRIVDETGAREIHASARRIYSTNMSYRNTSVSMGATYGPEEYARKVTDKDRVKSLIQIGKGAA